MNSHKIKRPKEKPDKTYENNKYYGCNMQIKIMWDYTVTKASHVY